jgi:hypothetical protein
LRPHEKTVGRHIAKAFQRTITQPVAGPHHYDQQENTPEYPKSGKEGAELVLFNNNHDLLPFIVIKDTHILILFVSKIRQGVKIASLKVPLPMQALTICCNIFIHT